MPVLLNAQNRVACPDIYCSGYSSPVAGTNLLYHSCHPLAKESLLTRCTNGKMKITWLTASFGEMKIDKNNVVYSWICAFSSGTSKTNHKFDLWMNSKKIGCFETIKDSALIIWHPENDFNKVKLDFHFVKRDHVSDCHGYMMLSVPSDLINRAGQTELSVCGNADNSNDWFMIFKYDLSEKIVTTIDPAILKFGDSQYREIRFIADAPYPCTSAHVQIDGVLDTLVNVGYECMAAEGPVMRSVFVPESKINDSLRLKLEIGNKKFISLLRFCPVNIKEIFLIHHSHNDIGYTDVQPEVMNLQIQNFRRALVWIEKFKKYPEGSRYKWNSEVNWPVDEFMKRSDDAEKKAFITAVKEGYIGLNGLYDNPLTGISKAEELMQIAADCRVLADKYGLKYRSAMISDIPGLSWAMVPALYHAGIRYLSSGPNPFDRIGWSTEKLGDVPFYWASASGDEKILVWIASMGYAMFHQQNTIQGFTDFPIRLFSFIDSLEARNYPYDMAQLRVALYSDNGPTDSTLSPYVKAWNDRYVYPKLRIATTDEMFTSFEKKYADQIPVLQGDYTPYWEDGALSTAAELGLNRKNSEKCIQLQTALAITQKQNISPETVEQLADAQKNILLFSEHTWGAQASISNPDDMMTLKQWQYKKQYALLADNLLKLVQKKILNETKSSNIEVINTMSDKRSGLVFIPSENDGKSIIVSDAKGCKVQTQQVNPGTVAFYASDIPALGSACYKIKVEKSETPVATVSGLVIENEFLRVEADQNNGTVLSMIEKQTGRELSANGGLNELYYVKGLLPESATKAKVLKSSVLCNGPLVWHMQILLSAEGFDSVYCNYILYKGEKQLRVNNVVYKKAERAKEAVYFRFPFSVEKPETRFDAGWSWYSPEKNRLPGSCNDFYYAMRWADVSNENTGAMLIVDEAPLLELSEITDETPHNAGPQGWQSKGASSSVFYSYVMNNYWHTNYKSDQDGLAEFNYVICPHDGFSYQNAFKVSQSYHQPLLYKYNAKQHRNTSLFDLKNSSLVVTSLQFSDDQKSLIIHIHNTSSVAEYFAPEWLDFKPTKVFQSDILQSKISEFTLPILMKPNGILILRCDF